MKALAEKSSHHRRARCNLPSSVAGERITSAPARLFRRIAATGSLAALLVASALVSSALVSASPARADEPAVAASSAPTSAPTASNLPPDEIERQAESIARSIMCPFCPGRTVSACPVAGPWREDIRHWVAEGVDSIEIKRRLAERVPEHNLGGVPKNRLGWVLPVGLGIAAFGLLIFLLRRLVGAGAATRVAGSKDAPEPAPAAAGPAKIGGPNATATGNGEDYDARLEDELETLER